MARIIINANSGGTGLRTVSPVAPKRSRQVLDPEVCAKIEARKTREGIRDARRKSRQKGPGGAIPQPVVDKTARVFVGIEPGTLVTVRGDRDTKWVVISLPSAKLRKRGTKEIVEVVSHTRRVGRAVVSVTLMGPDGITIEVPIGSCKPLYA